MNFDQNDPRTIQTLIWVMEKLRDREDGCPWDVDQTFDSIAPFTVEEAYEVADAIQRKDYQDLKEELGDLLFQTIFHAQMAHENGLFDFFDIVETITRKMVRRHPHVFGDADERDANTQTQAWEKMKADERAAKGHTSLLDDVPVGLPGMTRAVKLQKRAARIGFDWDDPRDVLDKIAEETEELTEAINKEDADHIEEEFGDLMFVMANLARHLNIEPEHALRRANQKFSTRFRHVENRYNDIVTAEPDTPAPDLHQMEVWWQEAKKNN